MVNISATKLDLALEGRGSSARKHAHEDPDYHEMTVVLKFSCIYCTVQAASSTRCVFYDVGANGGCLLHLCILLTSMCQL